MSAQFAQKIIKKYMRNFMNTKKSPPALCRDYWFIISAQSLYYLTLKWEKMLMEICHKNKWSGVFMSRIVDINTELFGNSSPNIDFFASI